MGLFNTKTVGTKTVNLAGGEAYLQSPELELVSILLTSFGNDKYYEKAPDTFNRLKVLIGDCDKKFVAQAAIYARTEFGMRSISHVCASELAKHIGGQEWATDFYRQIVYRPDDMLEILSYHTKNNGKISAAMKRGFAVAFMKFDAYSLAKYRGEGKGYKLVDVVNLVHPIPTERNAEALKQLVAGELKSFDTWESELSKSGQAEDKEAFKKDVWVKLIRDRKLGYFALLRNLRNIIEQAPEMVVEACEMLQDESLIRKSLVLPFRFSAAYEEIKKISGKEARYTLSAISKAVDISVKNCVKFDGATLVVLDVSGSMTGKPAQIGSLFSAVLMKSCNADFMVFSNDAKYQSHNIDDSTLSLADSMKFAAGGTNFQAIFDTANKPYDRVIILSDMQGWVGYNAPTANFNAYCKRTNCRPKIFSFDLNGYGTLQMPEQNIYCMAGFSEKTLELMKLLEADKNALVNRIREVHVGVNG